MEKEVKLFYFNGIERLRNNLLKKNIKPMTKIYNKNEIIHHAGDECRYLGIIESGLIHIQHTTSDGREIMINSLSKNQMYGEILLFSHDDRYPYTIIAGESNTTTLRIRKKDLISALVHEPELLTSFLTHLSDSYMKLNKYIKLLSQKTLSKKIAFYIIENGQMNQGCVTLYLKSKTKLADYLLVERPSLVRELTKLKKNKVIDYDKDKIVVQNLKKLKALI